MTMNASGTAHMTPEGKWYIWPTAGGDPLTRWPVDARTLVATGGYTLEPAAGAVPNDDLSTGQLPSTALKLHRSGAVVEDTPSRRRPNEHPPELLR